MAKKIASLSFLLLAFTACAPRRFDVAFTCAHNWQSSVGQTFSILGTTNLERQTDSVKLCEAVIARGLIPHGLAPVPQTNALFLVDFSFAITPANSSDRIELCTCALSLFSQLPGSLKNVYRCSARTDPYPGNAKAMDVILSMFKAMVDEFPGRIGEVKRKVILHHDLPYPTPAVTTPNF